MLRYDFHIDDGNLVPDEEGTELADTKEARTQAVVLAGGFLKDMDGSFWDKGEPWVLHVTDDESRLLFSLQFGAIVPSGEVLFAPLVSGL
jgi:hypothetical protein